jgi:hypothetical protein
MSRLLLPGMLSAFSKNHCPDCAGITVRFKQESLSGISRNAVRNQQESLSGLGKNMQVHDRVAARQQDKQLQISQLQSPK